MFALHNIDYAIADLQLLRDVNLQISAHQHIGLVGRNGSGKSTLFNIIQGTLVADRGRLECAKQWHVLTVKQELPDGDLTPLEFLLSQDKKRLQLLESIKHCEDPNLLANLYDQLIQIDAYSAEARAATILKGLGFSDDEQNRLLKSFSGGFQMRVALAAALFQQPDLLLLDEPTNHLDIETVAWFRDFLRRYPKSFLLISHDRNFLNRTVSQILHLKNGQINRYGGNFDTFLTTYQMQQQNISAQNSKLKLQQAHILSFVSRFRASATKAKQAQSRLKALEKLQFIPVEKDDPTISFQFPEPECVSGPLISFSKVTIGYSDRTILRNVTGCFDSTDRIALVGANGQGKTTFARFLSGELPAKKGFCENSRKLTVAFYHQALGEVLESGYTAYRHISERLPAANNQQIRTHLGRFGFSREKAEQKVAVLSGGEKARLLFACLTTTKPNLLILDEPTNHLDMEMREALIEALNCYNGAVLLISHDHHLLQHVADRLWIINNGTITHFNGDLQAYEASLPSRSYR